MNILFDIGHPAHVHLFKNLIVYFQNKGHHIVITAREKDITLDLLRHYNFECIPLSKPGNGIPQMLSEMIIRDFKILQLHMKHKFDIAVGTSVSIGILSLLTGARSYNFTEDDDHVIPLQVMASYPFCTKIINPNCLIFKKYRKKRVLHNSFQKLAYLHPNNFTPDISIVRKYKLEPYKYIIIRNSALMAHHDVGAKGIDSYSMDKLLDAFQGYQLISSKENDKSHEIEPWDMHHILSFAKMLVTDSLSMSVEASVLGVPSVRYNSFFQKSSVLDELEYKFGLTFGFHAGKNNEIERMYEKILSLLKIENLNDIWQKKRETLLKHKIDLNQWMICYFESEFKKVEKK